ncbi:oxidoreductase [Kwoniella heveanensis CBS 569]|nr:oxidoreductase [Kwoniella heveanensis CBS 569]
MSDKLPFVLGCSVPLSSAAEEKLKSSFKGFHYHPNKPDSPAKFTKEELSEIEFFFTTGRGLPVSSLDELPKLKHIQLASAGSDAAQRSEAIAAYKEKAGQEQAISLSTASGTHVLSIPNYAVAMVIALYHQLPRMITRAKDEKRWLEEEECDRDGQAYYARSLHGRTAGLLGYGALGRETARLLKAHGMKIIAANTSGKASSQDGYVIPGTGDKDGSIPEQYYSTKDSKSLEKFLKQSDVLICSLPGTPDTKYFLNKERLALLPPNAVLVNVGRGSLIPSDDLLAALDAPKGLFGAALDVTDPEPLPANHPIWSHPKVVITPHTSGNTEGEMDIAAEIALYNAKKLAKGEAVINRVKFDRGY